MSEQFKLCTDSHLSRKVHVVAASLTPPPPPPAFPSPPRGLREKHLSYVARKAGRNTKAIVTTGPRSPPGCSRMLCCVRKVSLVADGASLCVGCKRPFTKNCLKVVVVVVVFSSLLLSALSLLSCVPQKTGDGTTPRQALGVAVCLHEGQRTGGNGVRSSRWCY